ncbi:MAG: ABC transporter ATPase [Flavobacteriales bacterium]|nr:ABC transporter ATPase [Flavobacteriales bacterium]
MKSFNSLSGDSRIWVYQSSRELSDDEVSRIQNKASSFIVDWAAHGALLEASIEVFHNIFVVVCVDENHAGATGCSIDKSFKFIADIETQFEITLLDRMIVAYYEGEDVKSCSLSEFKSRLQDGQSDENTLVFNNLIEVKQEMDAKWVLPVKDSWHAQLLN